jgi:hypothetical protein
MSKLDAILNISSEILYGINNQTMGLSTIQANVKAIRALAVEIKLDKEKIISLVEKSNEILQSLKSDE